jgi:cytoskeletal protein CcmA (bactofilin family)
MLIGRGASARGGGKAVFFRKNRKYSDVEGYNRISQLIEDRQRELGDPAEPEPDFDEEGVLLTREPLPRERSGLRLADEGPALSAVRPVFRASDDDAVPPSVTGDDRRVPFQPDSTSEYRQPTVEPAPAVVETPVAPVFPTELSAGSGCLIAAEASWEGKLATKGDVRVEGTVRGEIETTGTLWVAAKARIEGTVQARSMMLAGEVEGQVTCSERLEIFPGGTARGEVETASLVVHEGAFIDSRFQVLKTGPPALG